MFAADGEQRVVAVIKLNKKRKKLTQIEEEKKAYASYHQVIVNTTPPIYMSNKMISMSDKIRKMQDEYKGNEVDQYGNKCLVKISHEAIPIEVWEILNHLFDQKLIKTKCVFKTITFDALFWILAKYNISMAFISAPDLELLKKICGDLLLTQDFIKLPSLINDKIYVPFLIDIAQVTVTQIMQYDARLEFMSKLRKKSLWLFNNLIHRLAFAYLA